MPPRRKSQPLKKTKEVPIMEERDDTTAAENNGDGEVMGAWEEEEIIDEPVVKKGKRKVKTVEEEDEEIRDMVDRPRLTVESALAQLKMEEMGLREFIDELKSKSRHLTVEEERLRQQLNKKLAQEMANRNGGRM